MAFQNQRLRPVDLQLQTRLNARGPGLLMIPIRNRAKLLVPNQSDPISVAISRDMTQFLADNENRTFEWRARDLPTGLSISTDGEVTGTPTVAAPFGKATVAAGRGAGLTSSSFVWTIT